MIKKFNDFKINESDNRYPGENSEIDYDFVLTQIKEHGWGDISAEYFDEFENSKNFSGDFQDTKKYLEEFIIYMNKIKLGEASDTKEHINWVIDTLESWATTYEDDDDGFHNIMGLSENLRNDNCTIDDYDEILFHLWQSLGQEK
jgi:hypothetical protein